MIGGVAKLLDALLIELVNVAQLGEAVTDLAAGHVLSQSVVLGFTQIVISGSVNALIAMAAGGIALFLKTRPFWSLVQRWLMGTVLAGFALRMAMEARR